jgi:preprotein translocase subunit SecE
MNDYLVLALWVGVIGALFAFSWRKGYLRRMRTYILETRQELIKCTWPTREELRGSTVVVSVAFTLMALFTVTVDLIVSYLIGQLI